MLRLRTPFGGFVEKNTEIKREKVALTSSTMVVIFEFYFKLGIQKLI